MDEEEDLTKFDLDALIDLANEIGQDMAQHDALPENSVRLLKVANELVKKTGQRSAPARIQSASRPIEKEIRGSRTKNFPSPKTRGR